jgi:UV DNA damage repair endonuclease
MVRISSDVLPAYTAPGWRTFYRSSNVLSYLNCEFSKIGELARRVGVRLSFHPGQFTVLASDRPTVVEASIEEFEYHADMARMMGYGKTFQDFKINVHISGKLGASGIIAVLPRLSNEARNCITIENEEMSYGLDDCLALSDYLPIVLDIHHHWIKSSGEYITASDSKISRVIDSWRGVRPVIHYSVSREDLLCEHSVDLLPDYKLLVDSGHKKTKLRAHSDYMWNKSLNNFMQQHWAWADIMVESKAKNLASMALYEQLCN